MIGQMDKELKAQIDFTRKVIDLFKKRGLNSFLPALGKIKESLLKKNTTIFIECSYCGKDMGTKPGLGVTGVSHSFCNDCDGYLESDIADYNESLRQKH